MCGRGLLWKLDAPDATNALEQRDVFLAALAAHDGWVVDPEAAKSVFTELLANVLHHGKSPVSVWLHCPGDEVKLNVLEFGLGFSNEPRLPSPLSEGGRGLFLVSNATAGLKIDGDPHGTHIIATLPRKSDNLEKGRSSVR